MENKLFLLCFECDMKKLIIGLLIMSITPFLVILGYLLISYFKVPDDISIVSMIFGLISLVVNYVIGIIMLIQGHQDLKSFNL